MALYQPMPSELETGRLALRPWAQADSEGYRALVAERDSPPVSDGTWRERITAQRASSARAGCRYTAAPMVTSSVTAG